MATPTNSDLQLVPEIILKRKHDLDEMKAHRAAQQILNPKGNNKIFNRKNKAVKVHKPETILANARSQRNHMIRYRRVMKKGMMKRASEKKIIEKKIVAPDEDDGGDEEMRDHKEIEYAANSVGAKLVFVVRIREPNGMPKNVKRVLDSFRLKSANEVSITHHHYKYIVHKNERIKFSHV